MFRMRILCIGLLLLASGFVLSTPWVQAQPPRPEARILEQAADPYVWQWDVKGYVLEKPPLYNPKTHRVLWHVQSLKSYSHYDVTLAKHEFVRYGPQFVDFMDEDGVVLEMVTLEFQGPRDMSQGGPARFLAFLDGSRRDGGKLQKATSARVFPFEPYTFGAGGAGNGGCGH